MHRCYVELMSYFAVKCWETLETRRKLHQLNLLFKIKNNLAPLYLSNILTPVVSTVHNYPLRNAHHLRQPRAYTTPYQRSFLPSSINLWNQLPIEITSLTYFPQFKRDDKLHLCHQRSPAHWSFGKRSLSILHTRHCLGHSGLNAHLCSHGRKESKHCDCGFSHRKPQSLFFHVSPICCSSPRPSISARSINSTHWQCITCSNVYNQV